MNREFVEILEHKDRGYKPVAEFGSWKVAVMNTVDKFKPENISYMEKHLETDEVFILLKGQCKLLIGGKGEKPDFVDGILMEPGKVYNVKKNVWHTQILHDDTSLIIVENADTCADNTSYVPIPKGGV
jgi:ureidoglycolate hydrolase